MTKTIAFAAALAALMFSGVCVADVQQETDQTGNVSYTELIKTAKPGVDFNVVYKPGVRSFLIAAPHGGNIEPGSSELAEAIANNRYGSYAFNGLKRDSSSLCVSSARYDEPELQRVTKNYGATIAIHVIPGTDRVVYVGGNYRQLGDALVKSLSDRGYQAKPTPDKSSAWNRLNIINKGTVGGVQIEVSSALVDDMFRGPASNERVRQDINRRTLDFTRFVGAVSIVLDKMGNSSGGVKVKPKDDKK